jgi:hypothetical protein
MSSIVFKISGRAAALMDKMPLLLHVFYEPPGLIKCRKLLTALSFFKMPQIS